MLKMYFVCTPTGLLRIGLEDLLDGDWSVFFETEGVTQGVAVLVALLYRFTTEFGKDAQDPRVCLYSPIFLFKVRSSLRRVTELKTIISYEK